MKALLRLAVSPVVVAANAYAVESVVEMADFELDLEYRDIKQLEAIAKTNIKVAFGVDAFTEHYRAHMWDIRNNYKRTLEKNEIVRYESLKYYNTVYKLIPTELARCIFDIKGGMVEYTDNYNDILECQGSVPVEQYNQSNWNYVVFVNVLNAKMNGDTSSIETIGERITQRFGAGYASLIKWAVDDIKEYFAALKLEKYILEMNQLRKDIREAEDAGEKFSNTKEGGCYSELDAIWHETVKSLGTVKMKENEMKLRKLKDYWYTYDLSITYDVLRNNKGKSRQYEIQYYLPNETKELETYAPLTIDQEENKETKVDNLIKQAIEEADYNMLHDIVSKLPTGKKLSLRNGLNKIRKKAEEGKTITSEDEFANIVYGIIQLMDGSTVSGLPDMAPESTEKEASEAMTDFIKNKVAELKQAIEAEFQRQKMDEKTQRQNTIKELKKKREELQNRYNELQESINDSSIDKTTKEQIEEDQEEVKNKITDIDASIERLGKDFFKGDKIATKENTITEGINYILIQNIFSDEDIETIGENTRQVRDDEFDEFAKGVEELTEEEIKQLEEEIKQLKEKEIKQLQEKVRKEANKRYSEEIEKNLLVIVDELKKKPDYIRVYKEAIKFHEILINYSDDMQNKFLAIIEELTEKPEYLIPYKETIEILNKGIKPTEEDE